jgi:hypothetical protein
MTTYNLNISVYQNYYRASQYAAASAGSGSDYYRQHTQNVTTADTINMTATDSFMYQNNGNSQWPFTGQKTWTINRISNCNSSLGGVGFVGTGSNVLVNGSYRYTNVISFTNTGTYYIDYKYQRNGNWMYSGITGTVSAATTATATPVASNINEGSALTINVATTNVANSTTLYWSVTNTGDFSTSTGSFTVSSSAGSFTVSPTSDQLTEGAETFQVQIRTGSISGTILGTSSAITINDTSQASGYAVTPATSAIDEGSALTVNATTTGLSDGTTVYWSLTSAADFTASTGSFTTTSNAGSFTVTPTEDDTTEGSETFQVQLRTGSVSGTVVATSSAITINDTSIALPQGSVPLNNQEVGLSGVIERVGSTPFNNQVVGLSGVVERVGTSPRQIAQSSAPIQSW